MMIYKNEYITLVTNQRSTFKMGLESMNLQCADRTELPLNSQASQTVFAQNEFIYMLLREPFKSVNSAFTCRVALCLHNDLRVTLVLLHE